MGHDTPMKLAWGGMQMDFIFFLSVLKKICAGTEIYLTRQNLPSCGYDFLRDVSFENTFALVLKSQVK